MPGEAFGSADAPVNDAATAQFDHRLVAYGVIVFALAQFWAAARAAPEALALRAGWLVVAVSLQVVLGITTLLWSVPIAIALAHQAVALILFGLACAHWSATNGAAEFRADQGRRAQRRTRRSENRALYGYVAQPSRRSSESARRRTRVA